MSSRVIALVSQDRRYRRKVSRLSPDKERYLETVRHHPMKNPYPHPPRTRWKQRTAPGPWHNPHSRPHEEALGPHTDKPGPIRFPARMTRDGTKG